MWHLCYIGDTYMPQSSEILRIRCTQKNKIGFKVYAAYFTTYNEALASLLDAGDKLDIIRRSRIK